MLVISGQAMAKASQEFRKPVFPSHFPLTSIIPATHTITHILFKKKKKNYKEMDFMMWRFYLIFLKDTNPD